MFVRRTVLDLRELIKAAADAGARIVAGPLYCPVGYLPGRRRTVDEWNRAVDGYRSIASTLEENDVTLAIEPLNRFETFFLNTAADAAALCDEVGHPNVGILFDTFMCILARTTAEYPAAGTSNGTAFSRRCGNCTMMAGLLLRALALTLAT